MGQQHRALGVSSAGGHQVGQDGPGTAFRSGKAFADGLGAQIMRQPAEPLDLDLAVEGTGGVTEGGREHARLGPGEDVAGGDSLVLGVTAQDGPGALDTGQVLELVENEQHPGMTAAALQGDRQVEQRVQGRQRIGARILRQADLEATPAMFSPSWAPAKTLATASCRRVRVDAARCQAASSRRTTSTRPSTPYRSTMTGSRRLVPRARSARSATASSRLVLP